MDRWRSISSPPTNPTAPGSLRARPFTPSISRPARRRWQARSRGCPASSPTSPGSTDITCVQDGRPVLLRCCRNSRAVGAPDGATWQLSARGSESELLDPHRLDCLHDAIRPIAPAIIPDFGTVFLELLLVDERVVALAVRIAVQPQNDVARVGETPGYELLAG